MFKSTSEYVIPTLCVSFRRKPESTGQAAVGIHKKLDSGFRRNDKYGWIAFFLLIAAPVFAQEAVQMIFEQEVTPAYQAVITVVAESASREKAQASVTQATEHAKQVLEGLDSKETLIKSHLAETISKDLVHNGYENSFVELGGIFIANGHDFNGSWKIPVIDKTTSSAQRAFYYKATNVSAATVESENSLQSEIKSVTVFSEEGALEAEHLASAAVSGSLSEAKKILKKGGATRFVLIDQNGNFLQNP